MKIVFYCFSLVLISFSSLSQFAPAAGIAGTTAIYKDSAVFIAWATTCEVTRGRQDISNDTSSLATVGDSSSALGMAGTNGVVSLGDGGSAILQFEKPITNGEGRDFAIFENAFLDTYLELGFVEVSSDGVNYFRFPCTSNTQDTLQIGGFGSVDPSLINNLAGKYIANYGTPFDLEELSAQGGLNVNAITHVKIIDVVGCIQTQYARYDQYGHAINELWNTPFPSSGFDLDAVGVIHQATNSVKENVSEKHYTLFPNPTSGFVTLNGISIKDEIEEIRIINNFGQLVYTFQPIRLRDNFISINLTSLNQGFYKCLIKSKYDTSVLPLSIINE